MPTRILLPCSPGIEFSQDLAMHQGLLLLGRRRGPNNLSCRILLSRWDQRADPLSAWLLWVDDRTYSKHMFGLLHGWLLLYFRNNNRVSHKSLHQRGHRRLP